MNLPDEWGMPLGWSLAFIPILIILGGLTFQMFWQCRGIPFRMVCNFKVSLSLSSSSHSILYLPTSIFIFESEYCMEKSFIFTQFFANILAIMTCIQCKPNQHPPLINNFFLYYVEKFEQNHSIFCKCLHMYLNICKKLCSHKN